MSRDRLNQWAALDYFDPVKVMREAHRQGFKHKFGSPAVPPPNVLPRKFKLTAEALDAAVFACGLAARVPHVAVHVAEFEAQDHDFVLRFAIGDEPYYCPLQLKQLVSSDTSANATPGALLESLKKYADASDLVVAIKIDRVGIDPRTLQIPPLSIAELWFFGQLPVRTRTSWYLYGNCLDSPEWFEFSLPE